MSMQDTVKMMQPLDFKSVAHVCSECGVVYKIKKVLMDAKRTFSEHGVCYCCFKTKLKKLNAPRKHFFK